MSDSLALEMPSKLRPFMEPARFKGAKGGRGSGKSWSVARMLLAKGLSGNLRWLCAREIQKSIKESVHTLLADQIRAMNLGDVYEVQRDVILGPDSTRFAFAGLQDHTADSIKSFEGYDGAWIEEAHTVKARSWEILTPTIRKPGSEIWATWNPESPDDPVEDLFVHNPLPGTVCVEMNWRDNPWFPDVLVAEMEQMKRVNYDLYLHVWEGQYRTDAGMMFKRDWFRWYERTPKTLNVFMASDYAVTEDAGDFTEHGVFGLAPDGGLYVLDWWSGQTAPETWIEAGLRLVQLHKPRMWFEEKGVILRAVDSAIKKRMREKQIFTARVGLPSASNKAARALGFAARASAGAVYLPSGREWAQRLLNQLASFTGEDGRVDDAVDVCSLIGRGLDKMGDTQLPHEPEKRKPIKPFSIEWLEQSDKQDALDAEQRAEYYR